MNMSELLGMRMEDALKQLREQGETAEVVVSSNPRRRDEGTLRVVRVRPGQITVCAFKDGSPER